MELFEVTYGMKVIKINYKNPLQVQNQAYFVVFIDK